MMMRLSNFLHALSAIAGFAAGGLLVILVVAMMPGPRPEDADFARPRGAREIAPAAVPLEARRPTRAELPEPINGRIGTPRGPSVPIPPFRSSIDSDSLAALVAILRDRDLELPVAEIDRDDLRDDYGDPRPGGRTHEALDIPAPRGTPVVAVEDGTIASLDPSQGGGGIVVYQYDPSGEFAYYYAHLEGYADGLKEGQAIERGEILGYVGTSGNAPPDVPHLHFAIYKTVAGYTWWRGIPVNPFSVLR